MLPRETQVQLHYGYLLTYLRNKCVDFRLHDTIKRLGKTHRAAVAMGAAPERCPVHECKVEVNGRTRISAVAEFKTQVEFYFIPTLFSVIKEILVTKYCHNLTQE